VAVELTGVVHAGDLDALRRLIADRPELASVRMIGRKGPDGGWRTPLHAAADLAWLLSCRTGNGCAAARGRGRPE
jgi:hypothetical protein